MTRFAPPVFGRSRLVGQIGLPRTLSYQSVGASLGAPFIVQPETVRLRAEGLDRGIQSLTRDVKANLVYNDPNVLRATATTLEAGPGGGGTGPLSAADLRAEAAKLDARIKAAGPTKAAAERAFSKSFGDYATAWNAFYATNVADPTLFTNGANYDKIDNFDTDYRNVQVPAYKKFGFPLTYLAPGPNAGKEPGIPWTTILWIVGIGTAAFFLHEAKGVLPASNAAPLAPPAPAPRRIAAASDPVIHDAEFVED